MTKISDYRLYYLFGGRLPTEKANGKQTLKTCEALNKIIDTTLFYPSITQRDSQLNVNILKYYGIPNQFKIVKYQIIDILFFLEKLSMKLAPIGAVINRELKSKAIIRIIKGKFKNDNAIFYTRHRDIALSLLYNKDKIAGKIVFETHSFSKKHSPKIISKSKELDYLITITHNLKRIYSEHGFPEKKIIVASDAVDLTGFEIEIDSDSIRRKLEIPSDAFVIGYIGKFHTLGMEKGIPELIQAVKILHERYGIKAYLLCVGGPMDRVVKYKEQIEIQNIDKKYFVFHDLVPNKHVPSYINASNCVTIPWQWNDFSAYYTSPMKLFEYMASGVPIVASKLPSLEEVLNHRHNALLHEPGNPKDMAEAFQNLKVDKKLGNEISSQALIDIREYTWDKRAKRILDGILKA